MATSINNKELALVLKLRDEFTHTLKKSGDAVTQFEAKSTSSFSSVDSAVQGLVAGFGFMAAAMAVKNTVMGILDVSNEVETLELRLYGLKGGTEGAAKAMQYFRDIASTVPFSLGEVSQAGVTIEAFGADAEKSLKQVTDLAAFMGTDLATAAQAFGRAWAGGAGGAIILRKRGVLNQIQEMRPELGKLIDMDLPKFRKVLLETMSDPMGPIANSASRMADTLKGKWSMLEDATYSMALALGDAGLSDAAKVAIDMLKGLAQEGQDVAQAMAKAYKESGALAGVLTGLHEWVGVGFFNKQLEDGLSLQDKNIEDARERLVKAQNEFAGIKDQAATHAYSALINQNNAEKRIQIQATIDEEKALIARLENLKKIRQREAQQEFIANGGEGSAANGGPTEEEIAAQKKQEAADEAARVKILARMADFGKSKEILQVEQFARERELLKGNNDASLLLTEQFLQQLADAETARTEKANLVALKDEEKRSEDAAKAAEKTAAFIQGMQDEMMAEEELLTARYDRQVELYQGNQEVLLLLEMQYNNAKAELRKADTRKTLSEEEKLFRTRLAYAHNLGSGLTSIAELFNKKNGEQNKVAGVVSATTSMWVGAAKALELPFPANIAAWGQVLLTGKKAIEGIRSGDSSGGSASVDVPGVSAEAPTPLTQPTPEPRGNRQQTIIIQGTVLGTEEFVREQLAPLIASAAADNVDFNLVTKVEGQY